MDDNHYESLQLEFDEFRKESQELEAALEKEVDVLTASRDSVKRDLDDLKARFLSYQAETNKTISTLETEIEILRKKDAEYKVQTRDLEIQNAEFQQSLRVNESSSSDWESRYNKSLERITLLEHEVELKGKLVEDNQRLHDEVRDLQEEVARHLTRPTTPSFTPGTTASSIPTPSSARTNSKQISGKLTDLVNRAKQLESRIAEVRENVVAPMLK
ncbi:hypothetical protein SmJEL517_g02705 [Synchytrium microbalum]|uniref:NUDE domain-containing protein n=1 Tax=Synchytrium microbalum TaxID=1806994 RepID=A0A507C0Q4_9FUNG|nr:uncharacterized protein SmJEL517_g02705 [Synchytrium microbalum]TPX34667.1 hypothetical protein SmJEL517_g02705 [Synchytrium microbalum]